MHVVTEHLATAQEVARVADQPAVVDATLMGLAAAETEVIELWCDRHETDVEMCTPGRRCEGPTEHYVSPFDAAIEDLPEALRKVAQDARRTERLRRERAAAIEDRENDIRAREE